ncbi:MAG: hypothetical protein LBE13_18370, partial [Bacteroidales bacterium]|nr:hypothetical protein [Bacteroidales bacterium]
MKKFLMIILILVGLTLHVQAQKKFSQEEIEEGKAIIMNLCKLVLPLYGIEDKDLLNCACKVTANVSVDFILEKYGNKEINESDMKKYYMEINDPNSELHNEYVTLLQAEWDRKCGNEIARLTELS